ncbi:MAG: hypothetical protein JWQ35_573, partial [Bacteriovoracaceae bacterium]|nr:hypothetical protein [Bacteriovoracaceae bacterium]
WQTPDCTPSQEIQIELKPTGDFPVPGGNLQVVIIRKGEWLSQTQPDQIAEKIVLEESAGLDGWPQPSQWFCRITTEIRQPTYSASSSTLLKQPCSDLKDFIGSEITGDNRVVNNFVVRPIFRVGYAE